MAQKQIRNATTVGNISGGLWSAINFVQKSDTQVARIDILDGVSSQSEGKEIKQFIKDNSTPAYVAPAFGGVITNKFVQSGSAYALIDNNFYNVFENASIPNDPGTTSIYNSIVNYVNFENIFGFNTDADNSAGGSKLSNNNKIYLQFSYKTKNSPIEKQVKLESNTISFAGGSVTGTQAVFKWDGAVDWTIQAGTSLPMPIGETVDNYFILWVKQNSTTAQISMFQFRVPQGKTDKVWDPVVFRDEFSESNFRLGFVITADNVKSMLKAENMKKDSR